MKDKNLLSPRIGKYKSKLLKQLVTEQKKANSAYYKKTQFDIKV